MSTDNPSERDRPPKKKLFQKIIPKWIRPAPQEASPAASRLAVPQDLHGLLPASEVISPTDTPDNQGSTEEQLDSTLKTISVVATAVWRMKAKLELDDHVELPERLRNLPRHVRAASDALDAGRIQVEDLKGERYVPGMAVNVLTFQPLDGLGSEVIHETIKPTIYFRDRLIQRADVIVARPLRSSDTERSVASTDADSAHTDDRSSAREGAKSDGADDD